MSVATLVIGHDIKIGCISRRNQWSKLIFGVDENLGDLKDTLIIFVLSWFEMGVTFLVLRLQNQERVDEMS